MNLDVVAFVNDGKRKKAGLLKPILVKMFLFTFMVTIAMILIYTNQRWAGFVIYGKEVIEFIVFICFLVRRRGRYEAL